MVQLRVDDSFELPAVHADLLENWAYDPLGLFDKRSEQVNRLDLRVAPIRGETLGALQRFLRFDGEFVESNGRAMNLSRFREIPAPLPARVSGATRVRNY
jgi:hypothetical protein